jgi:nicotinamide-nucleotide amidase
MHAEIISVGTELTTGAKLDTNSQWLSLELAEIGIPVLAHQTISDDLDAMVDSIRTAAERSEIVLITGGLGPTLDDLTRDVLAKFANVDLVQHDPSLEHVKSIFAKRNRPMPERNIMQAMFPRGSEPLPNPRGTAPGIWMQHQRTDGSVTRIAAMPGVPSEMKQMFRQQVLPRLDGRGQVIRRARINLFATLTWVLPFMRPRSRCGSQPRAARLTSVAKRSKNREPQSLTAWEHSFSVLKTKNSNMPWCDCCSNAEPHYRQPNRVPGAS